MKNIFIALNILLFTTICFGQGKSMDLSGQWNVWLASEDLAFDQFAFDKENAKSIHLPSTLDEAGIGLKTTDADVGRLSRKYKYYGAAWYKNEITIPEEWEGKNFELFLERVMWKSELWIDGRFMGTAESLGSPHKFDIGSLSPGEHSMVLKINNDMIYNIGDVGHTYTDFTQTKWKGVLGRMELLAFDSVKIVDLKVFPHLKSNAVDVNFRLDSELDGNHEVLATCTLLKKASGEVIQEMEKTFKVSQNDAMIVRTMSMALSRPIKSWSEFDPHLYELQFSVISEGAKDKRTTTIGFRDIEHSKTKILINGLPTFMRGNLNNAEFPLTGYPPTDVAEWERIFRIHKSYGLNHVRFHSWCPPEAAFIAADKVGIYLQVETLWIAQWMRIEGRAFTPARPLPLGEDPKVSQYIEGELNRIVEAYGNHPSFTFLCVGNELDNGDYNIIQKWLDKLKLKDGDRRLYSLSASWDHAWKDQYKVTGEPYNRFFRKLLDSEKKDLGYPRFIKAPHSNWDYEELDSQSPVPLIVHEIGQQAMYPLWSEIDKYTGTLAPRNYIKFKESAIKNGVFELNEKFSQASGKLAQLLYKDEIEGMYRTPSCAGFELLGMQDFPGQGEALVGWLDAFYDSKGVTSPEEFIQHNDTTVVLMRTNSFVHSNTEKLKAKVQVHHFGTADINANIYWKVSSNDKTIDEGSFSEKIMEQGTITDIDSISVPLQSVSKASKIKLEIGVANSSIKNSWDFWVYPKIDVTELSKDVLITSDFGMEAKNKLKDGGKVILIANKLGNKKSALKVSFNPLYWSLTWIPNQETKTLGTYVRADHPTLRTFPTDEFTGMQWQSISEGANSFYLDNLPKKYQPIVQPIYDFHASRKVGSIFEFKVGKGKLLVCGYDISDVEKPVARQLGASLKNYVLSPQFKPTQKVSETLLNEMFETKGAGQKAK